MILQFKFEDLTNKHRTVLNDFCKSLVKSIKFDISNGLIYQKFIDREQILLDATWINWIEKPDNINMKFVVDLIINNIDYKILKNDMCVIYIKGYLPMSRTKLETVARFLDKGNDKCPPTSFISSVTHKYKRNILGYWKSYIANKLGEIKVNERILIR